MKKLLLVVFLLPFFGVLAQDNHSYVGVEVCGKCHKSEKQGQQLSIWQDSKHSKAYETLKTEKADQIASEKGYTTKAIETEDCLKCHAVGYNLDASLLDKKFKVEDGVQCESCHGPGSDYKSRKIMKDREQSVANGLIVYENTEDFCTNCHNEESPTFVKFVFEEMWEKIKHSIPQ
ncbi:MAG: cytochrome c family protein [Ignavibacteria bacterium]|jgi:hypothetical protein